MEHPLKVQADLNRKTSILYFPNGDSAEFYMRGGICWPITYECRGKMENNGFALMAGQDIKTQNIYVFEEISFVTIENILNQATGQIEFHGLSYWFNKVWSEYYARKYFWGQDETLHRRHYLKVIRSPIIEPKPGFIEVPISDPKDVTSSIFQYSQTDKLKIEKESQLAEQIKMIGPESNTQPPSVQALSFLLVGFEMYPWREPREQTVQEVLIPA